MKLIVRTDEDGDVYEVVVNGKSYIVAEAHWDIDDLHIKYVERKSSKLNEEEIKILKKAKQNKFTHIKIYDVCSIKSISFKNEYSVATITDSGFENEFQNLKLNKWYEIDSLLEGV